jgi:hypothetical protein
MNEISISMTTNEWLVLFSFLASRINNQETIDFSHLEFADKVAFSNLLNVLESELAEPFMPNFAELVAQARMQLTDGLDESAF